MKVKMHYEKSFKKRPKTPIIYTQDFDGSLFTQVTGVNKDGHRMCFQFQKPENFMRSIYNPFLDYVFTITNNKLSFWSKEGIKEVKVHSIPDEVIKNERAYWYMDFNSVWERYINDKL